MEPKDKEVQKMIRNNDGECGFAVYRFMTYLDLTPSELLVYALLYSYTKSEVGVFFASLDYISVQTGVSRRTVNSAVKKLYERKLIERGEYGGVSGIRAVMSVAERLKKMDSAALGDMWHLLSDSKKSELGDIPHPKRRFVKGRYIIPDRNTGKVYDTEPKYSNITVGKDGRVEMTPEQYDKLKSLVPDRELTKYIDKLAHIHISGGERDKRWAKCDYRIIRKWIREDFTP